MPKRYSSSALPPEHFALLRVAAGLSQRELAQAMHYSLYTVRDWERGKLGMSEAAYHVLIQVITDPALPTCRLVLLVLSALPCPLLPKITQLVGYA